MQSLVPSSSGTSNAHATALMIYAIVLVFTRALCRAPSRMYDRRFLSLLADGARDGVRDYHAMRVAANVHSSAAATMTMAKWAAVNDDAVYARPAPTTGSLKTYPASPLSVGPL